MTYYHLIIIMISLMLLLSKLIIISTLNLCFLRLVELPIVIDYNVGLVLEKAIVKTLLNFLVRISIYMHVMLYNALLSKRRILLLLLL